MAKNAFSISWIIDSGATTHMTHSFDVFRSYKHCSKTKSILIADGKSIKVAGHGSIDLSPSFSITDVLHAP